MTRESPAEIAHRLLMEQVCGTFRDELIAAMKEEGLVGVGFSVTLQDFGEGGGFAYASNCNRQDMIKLFREVIEKLERGA
jgi:hypothetical protein